MRGWVARPDARGMARHSHVATTPFEYSGRATRNSEMAEQLAGRIQIWVLAHLPLHFLALFFVVEQNLAVAEMTALDFSLRFVEERFEAGNRPAARVGFAAGFQLGCFFRPVGRFQNFVVECK